MKYGPKITVRYLGQTGNLSNRLILRCGADYEKWSRDSSMTFEEQAYGIALDYAERCGWDYENLLMVYLTGDLLLFTCAYKKGGE